LLEWIDEKSGPEEGYTLGEDVVDEQGNEVDDDVDTSEKGGDDEVGEEEITDAVDGVDSGDVEEGVPSAL
jgi:hypothetical protein